MKITYYIAFIALFFIACEKQMDDFAEGSNEALEGTAPFIPVVQDSIVPLDSALFSQYEKVPKMNTAQYASIYEQLYELEGLNFYIQPKSVWFGKNTLQTTFSGGPVILGTKSSGNNQQLFYFQFLPASTGIPYLIKSYALNQPIGVGSYASNPSNYVLYTKSYNSNSLFGFSWDFYLNNNENGYIIENQDVIGSNGGSWWDIYHYAIQSQNGSLSMKPRNNASIYQHFNFVPNDMFNVQSVQLDFNDVIIKNTGTLCAEERNG